VGGAAWWPGRLVAWRPGLLVASMDGQPSSSAAPQWCALYAACHQTLPRSHSPGPPPRSACAGWPPWCTSAKQRMHPFTGVVGTTWCTHTPPPNCGAGSSRSCTRCAASSTAAGPSWPGPPCTSSSGWTPPRWGRGRWRWRGGCLHLLAAWAPGCACTRTCNACTACRLMVPWWRWAEAGWVGRPGQLVPLAEAALRSASRDLLLPPPRPAAGPDEQPGDGRHLHQQHGWPVGGWQGSIL